MKTKPGSIPAYPLRWPEWKPRVSASERRRSAFGERNWNKLVRELRAEVGRLGGTGLVISTNQPIRNDGEPLAGRSVNDPAAAIYFQLDGVATCLACDWWDSLAQNLRAITLHLDSVRGQNRWGVGTTKQAFAGFAALPAPVVEEDWWEVLEVQPSASEAVIKAVFSMKAKEAHPDSGGTDEAFQRLVRARDRALLELRGVQS